MKQEFTKNQLRERKNKSVKIDMADWENINPSTRYFFNYFFDINVSFTSSTLKQYKSALKIFFWYVFENLENRPIWQITKRDFLEFISKIQSDGMSSSGIKVKLYAIRAFCDIMDIYSCKMKPGDKYPQMRNFHNFSDVAINIPPTITYEKRPVTKKEFDFVSNALLEKGELKAFLYWGISFHVGARRSEMLQLKSEIVNYPKEEGKNYYLSHLVRLKGKGQQGKLRRFLITEEAMDYIKIAVSNQDTPCEFIFHGKDINKPCSQESITRIFREKISPILGRRITSHIMKHSCITYKLEQGCSMDLVSKYIGHHDKKEITSNYYDLRNHDVDLSELC